MNWVVRYLFMHWLPRLLYMEKPSPRYTSTKTLGTTTVVPVTTQLARTMGNSLRLLPFGKVQRTGKGSFDDACRNVCYLAEHVRNREAEKNVRDDQLLERVLREG